MWLWLCGKLESKAMEVGVVERGGAGGWRRIGHRRRRGMEERLGRMRFVSLRKLDRVTACCVESAQRNGLSESFCAVVECCTSLR